MVYRGGASTYVTAALFFACTILLCPQGVNAQGTAIQGCDLSAEAADTESAAAQAYANSHYKEGALGYQQAADFYHLCSVKASDPRSRDRAFYKYVLDLAFAAQHAPNGSALLQKVRKEADSFLRRSSDQDLVAKITALKSDPAHPERIATAQGTTSSNPSNPPTAQGPPSATVDRSTCASALTDFWKAYGDWASATGRYVASVQKTNSLLPKNGGASFAYGPASVYVIYEVRAIRSVVDAEEPKLSQAQARVQSSGAMQTANRNGEIVQAIRQLDAMALSWTQARSATITALANGQPADSVPSYDAQATDQLKAQINSKWNELHGANACTN